VRVGWNYVCSPKEEEGLGIKDLVEWNCAAMGKQLWRILQPATDTMWTKWVHMEWIKGRNRWELKVPRKCSWAWRKLLGLREKFKRMFKFKVGNGQNILL